MLDSDMLEKKNKRLFILFLALLSATFTAYWLGRSEEHFSVNKMIFKDFDLNSINEISLESNKGSVVLKYNGSRWRVNDQYPADPAMIDVLFATLQQTEPKRPLAASMQDSVAASLRRNGVKVSMFSSDEVQKTFIAGGNESKNQAFFLDSDGGEIYIVTIPGYRVYVSGIFELAETGWRDKFVFGFNWRNFQSLEVSFPRKPSDDFAVAMDNNYFSVQGLTQVDTTKLNDFLDDVSLLTVEDYLEPNELLDSLAKVGPYVTILVKDIAQKEYSLQLYPPIDNSSRFMGLINGSQWAIFQQGRVAKLVRTRTFFEK
ncbi:MAG: DUF4340 domain-containing protein [Cyclobacteriaceae bacterium]|nr:DUF4340 domain-containing protein [Cyclobacteriaceae bacterium]MDH5249051.1 DUF4340 domain-containing protein [Cyclobacteriaceae bacterium]